MSSPLLLCEPNVSEGRDREVVASIADAVRAVRGVTLIHRSADADHHRAVYAYLGEPEAVLAATRALAERALEVIDMRAHRGQHPRLGALDVVPFVPLRGVSRERALDVCHRFGRWVGELGVPVYYYEEAASRPERRPLPAVRAGQYEGLEARLADPAWAPDEGPAEFRPRAGAVIVGVRDILVRFNVNLRAPVEVAREIARAVRASGGGLPHVRALGFALAGQGLAQVSMNLTRYRETPISRVLPAVRDEASRRGAEIDGTEVVGPLPLDALVDAARAGLGAPGLATEQVIESWLTEGGA